MNVTIKINNKQYSFKNDKNKTYANLPF